MDRAQHLAGPGLATADDCDDGEEVSRVRLRYPKHLMSWHTIAMAHTLTPSHTVRCLDRDTAGECIGRETQSTAWRSGLCDFHFDVFDMMMMETVYYSCTSRYITNLTCACRNEFWVGVECVRFSGGAAAGRPREAHDGGKRGSFGLLGVAQEAGLRLRRVRREGHLTARCAQAHGSRPV